MPRNITLRRRFDVLRRDHFACMFCGRRPPTVELVVDHWRPVALGGTDDIRNLLTSCVDCNAGKSASWTPRLNTCGQERDCRCARPSCGGPRNPRDTLERFCRCDCHRCEWCDLEDCPGVAAPDDCTTPIDAEGADA